MPNKAHSIAINPLQNDFIKTINDSLSKCFCNKLIMSSEGMDPDRSQAHLGGNMLKTGEEFSQGGWGNRLGSYLATGYIEILCRQ